MNRILWKIAFMEIRGGFRYLWYFFVCTTLGVAGVAGVLGFSAEMKGEIETRAKSLVAGDIEIRTHSSLNAETGSAISDFLGDRVSNANIMELAGMVFVPESGRTLLVEIKSVSSGYPLYGKLSAVPDGSLPALFKDRCVLVDESLLLRLDLKTGDSITIGDATFKILGSIISEPDRLSGPFSLGPRVMMSSASLDFTKLVQPGSRVRYRYIYKLPADKDIDVTEAGIRDLIDDTRVEVTSYKKPQKRFLRFFNNISVYLGLLVTTGLILGGTGVAVSMHLFIQKKMDNMAILKSLGATPRTITGIYLRVVCIVSSTASLLGVIFGTFIQYSISSLFKELTPLSTSFTFSQSAVFQGIVVGLATSFLFSVGPLTKACPVRPSLIMLREVDRRFRLNKKRIFIRHLLTATGLSLIILQQAGSLALGGVFIGVITGTLLLLLILTSIVLYIIKKIPKPSALVFRMGLGNVIRPGNTTVTAITAIGIMSVLIMTLTIVKSRILKEIEVDLSKKSPSLYFIDIQKDQKEAFNSLMKSKDVETDIYPVVKGRLRSLNGKPVRRTSSPEGKNRWQFKREYAVTAKLYPSTENSVISGRWWTEDEFKNKPFLSVEKDIAKSLAIGPGSTVELDIQGKVLKAVVLNIRKVDWSGLTPNFFLVFTDNVLSKFTNTYISSARVSKAEEITLQNSVVAMFPNITVINIRTVLETLGNTLNQLSSIVEFLGKITILTAFVVLLAITGLAQAYSFRELRIMRTLGATTLFVGKTKSVEYGIVGLTAGVVSLAVSLLLSFLVLHFFMNLSFEVSPVLLLKNFAAILLFTMGTGFLHLFLLYRKRISWIFFE